MTEDNKTALEKQERLQQMRNAQKRLRERRKQEANMLSLKIQSLEEANKVLTLENKFLKLESQDTRKLLATELTKEQIGVLLRLRDDQSLLANDKYLTIEECKAKQAFYGTVPYSYYNGPNLGLFETIAEKYYVCIEKVNQGGCICPHTFKYSSVYGIHMIAKFREQVTKFHKQGLVAAEWYESEDDKNRPTGTVCFPVIVQSIIDKYDPETVLLELLIMFICRYSYVTAYGPVIKVEDLQRCHDLSHSSRFDAAYILGTLDKELYLADYMENMKRERKAEGISS